jgi:anti-sigma B factor antagonist
MRDARSHDASSDGARDFRISVELEAEQARVRIFGELDVSTAAELKLVLDGLSGTHDRLLLDLDRLRFMDSTGLAAIVHADLLASRNGQRLTIRCNAPQARRLFEVTGLRDQLTFDEG